MYNHGTTMEPYNQDIPSFGSTNLHRIIYNVGVKSVTISSINQVWINQNNFCGVKAKFISWYILNLRLRTNRFMMQIGPDFPGTKI